MPIKSRLIEIVDTPFWRVANTSRSPSGDQEGDEFYYSDLVAKHFGTRHHKIFIDSAKALPSLPGCIAALEGAGLAFRNDMETGPGGRQIQIEDPDGNPIELFEPAR